MIDKPKVGTGHIVTRKERLATIANGEKRPIYVPELRLTFWLKPGAYINAVIKRYRDQREWQRKTIH